MPEPILPGYTQYTKNSTVQNNNPATGQVINFSDDEINKYAGGKDGFLKEYSPTSPISSSNNVRNAQSVVQNEAGKVDSSVTNAGAFMDNQLSALLNTPAYGDTADGRKALDDLNTMRKNLGLFNDDEKAQIAEAGNQAAAEFDPLISDAEYEQQKGVPKAVVSGGEQGGFMNSQISGAAALLPTNGNTFIGAGGELESIKGIYDRNIDNLKSKRVQAQQAAQAAARQAIRTGKQADLKAAMDMMESARTAHNDTLSLIKEKQDALTKYQSFNEARVTQDLDRISKIGQVGGAVPDDLKANLDRVYGGGFSDKYSAAAKAAKEASTQDAKIDAFKKITDILKTFPKGQKLTIGDSEYTAIGDDKDNQIFQEETRDGTVTFVTVNKQTGEIVSKANGGRIGKDTRPTGPSGGLNSKQQADLAAIKAKLDAAKGADGKTNPALYGNEKASFAAANPAVADKFDSYFPPDAYLNPKDDTAAPYFGAKPSVAKPGAGGSTITFPDGSTMSL